MFYAVFEVKELFVSPEPDVWLRWDLDQNVAFLMDKWFILNLPILYFSTSFSFAKFAIF